MKIVELQNQCLWQAARAPFYEVYFLKFHVIEVGLAVWLRYTFHRPAKGEPHASLWAFCLEAKEGGRHAGAIADYGLEAVRSQASPFRLDIGEASLSSGLARGAVRSADFSLEWDLSFEGKEGPLELFPYDWMYRWKAFPKTKYRTVQPRLSFSGTLRWNGEAYAVKEAPGMQSHLWGSQHAERFLWAHCNTFAEDPEALFEGLSAQVRLGPWLAPPLGLFYIRMFGKEYLLNSPSCWFQKDIRRDLEEWNFDIQQGENRFVGAVGAAPSQFLGVRYSDPRGGFRYCNHAEWALASLEHYVKQGGRWCMQGVLSSKAATYEWVDSEPHPPVQVKILG